MRLQGKVVVITGASKGIGRSLARGLAKEGANVVANYRSDRAGAEDVVAEIARSGGPKAVAVGADVGVLGEIEGLFEQVISTFGRVDGLVNNAAIPGWEPILETTEGQWDRVMNTNLKGTFFCSLEAARRMKEAGGGAMVHVSSDVAALGVKNLAAYAISKGGIHAMTKQLAVELAPLSIRVNTFAPGPTRVERNLSDDPDYDQTWGAVVPLGRTAAADEMIGPAVFLLSDESSYVTGQLFYADGGWSVYGRIPEAHMDAVAEQQRGA